MTWASLASNQHTPTQDVENGVSTGALAWKNGITPSTLPVATALWTRLSVEEYLAVGTISGVDNLQHMTKSQIEAVKILPPGSTTLTLVAAGNQTVDLSWTAAIDALTYDIFRSTTDKANPAVGDFIDDTASFTFQDTGLTNGVTYYYWVAGVNQAGLGPFSNRITATPVAPALTPTDFFGLGFDDTPTVGQYTSALSWNNAGRTEVKTLEVFNRTGATWQTVDSNIGTTVTTYDHIFSSAAYADFANINGEVDYRIKFNVESTFATTTVLFVI